MRPARRSPDDRPTRRLGLPGSSQPPHEEHHVGVEPVEDRAVPVGLVLQARLAPEEPGPPPGTTDTPPRRDDGTDVELGGGGAHHRAEHGHVAVAHHHHRSADRPEVGAADHAVVERGRGARHRSGDVVASGAPVDLDVTIGAPIGCDRDQTADQHGTSGARARQPSAPTRRPSAEARPARTTREPDGTEGRRTDGHRRDQATVRRQQRQQHQTDHCGRPQADGDDPPRPPIERRRAAHRHLPDSDGSSRRSPSMPPRPPAPSPAVGDRGRRRGAGRSPASATGRSRTTPDRAPRSGPRTAHG